MSVRKAGAFRAALCVPGLEAGTLCGFDCSSVQDVATFCGDGGCGCVKLLRLVCLAGDHAYVVAVFASGQHAFARVHRVAF